MSSDLDGEIEDEVTRVEYVTYLEGATGHAVFSTLFLAVGCYFLTTGQEQVMWVFVGLATAISANGFSIYVWDQLRDRFRREDSPAAPDRTLTYHRPSNETQAELKAGFVMVGTLVVALLLVNTGLRYLGVQYLAYTIFALLSASNIGALVWSIQSSDEG